MAKQDDERTEEQQKRIAGASKGGKKRAEKQTPEERKELASRAAYARWANRQPEGEALDLPRAEFPGQLNLGGRLIDCAVLSDGRRILSERSVSEALGAKRAGSHWVRIKTSSPVDYKPVFISAGNLAEHIPPALTVALANPIRYTTMTGALASAYGVDATLLPDICEVWIKADQLGGLTDQQKHIAKNARILLSGLAKVGIIALVDEATGYQAVRARNELNRILEAYIAKELLPWTKRFPDEYYEELFRLRGWSYKPLSVKRPRMVGKITKEIVYDRLPPGVLSELQKLNPVVDNEGHRRYHHHRFLTDDVGNPHLEKHLLAIITLMRASNSWAGFKKLFGRAFPPSGAQQMGIPGVDDEDA